MIVIRTDASTKSGFQLLERSVYLASVSKRKADILFCINQDKTVVKFLNEKKISFCRPKDLFEYPVKSIVFYVNYFTPIDREIALRAKENNIAAVQIVLPGSTGSESLCDHLLSGPAFALLHSRFRHFNVVKRKYRKRVRNILISLEAEVEYRELRKIIDLLSRHRFNLKIAPFYGFKKSYKKILKRIYPGISFVGRVDSLARPFFEADAALIIPGTTACEAAAVGTPALYLTLSKELEPAADFFEKENLGIKISNINNLVEQIAHLTFERRIEIGEKGIRLADAKGVYRIIDFFKEKGII
jgi:spore coat polysaccharide biosynthesis predicted glycosyltransferase SpsG